MSQSENHKMLIIDIVNSLEIRFPSRYFITDLQYNLGERRPPSINGYIPDVYAGVVEPNDSILIAEAKTDGDIENQHTIKQLKAFLEYLEARKSGFFALSVSGNKANRAKVFLNFLRLDMRLEYTDLCVYDSLDFWDLNLRENKWDLY